MQKVIIVLSGVSGAGKSTYAKRLSDKLSGLRISNDICSADHYFEDSFGNYKFDTTKLGLAHQSCKDKCELLCQLAVNVIIIDNTSLNYKEISPYCAIAEKYKYKLNVLRIESDLANEELAARNKHGVSLEIIEKMQNKKESMESITSKIYKTYGNILCSPDMETYWRVD